MLMSEDADSEEEEEEEEEEGDDGDTIQLQQDDMREMCLVPSSNFQVFLQVFNQQDLCLTLLLVAQSSHPLKVHHHHPALM
jgi:hypothetical protein